MTELVDKAIERNAGEAARHPGDVPILTMLGLCFIVSLALYGALGYLVYVALF